MIINDITRIKPGINQVLIKLPKLNDEISISNGKSLFIDISYEPAKHVNVYGEVIALPSKLYFNKKDPAISLEFLPQEVIQVGDIVYFSYFHALQAMGDLIDPENAKSPKYVEYNGDVYIFLIYSAIYFAKRGEEIIPTNGYSICEELEEISTVQSGSIIIPDTFKKKKSSKYARVLFTGNYNLDYVSEKYTDPTDLSPGDIIAFVMHSNVSVENDIHQSFRKGKQILAIQGRWIMAKFENVTESITLDKNTSIKLEN